MNEKTRNFLMKETCIVVLSNIHMALFTIVITLLGILELFMIRVRSFKL